MEFNEYFMESFVTLRSYLKVVVEAIGGEKNAEMYLGYWIANKDEKIVELIKEKFNVNLRDENVREMFANVLGTRNIIVHTPQGEARVFTVEEQCGKLKDMNEIFNMFRNCDEDIKAKLNECVSVEKQKEIYEQGMELFCTKA